MPTTEARDARDNGIATASNHADRIDPTWRERAYNALVEHAKTHPTFTIEKLRAALGPTLEDPPSLRAWGGVARRAQTAGIIEHHGWTEADNPDCHCGEVRVWRSRIGPMTATEANTSREALFERAEAAGVAAYYGCKTWATDNKIRAAVRAALAEFGGAK